MLTITHEDGSFELKNGDITKLDATSYALAFRLHQYERTGMTPEQLEYIDEAYAKLAKKAAEQEAVINKLLDHNTL